MFTPKDIDARVRTQPFVPLRIITTAGQTFDIYHPDLILVGRRDLMVGMAISEDPSHYDQITRVALMHITALEDLPTPHAPTGNGQQ